MKMDTGWRKVNPGALGKAPGSHQKGKLIFYGLVRGLERQPSRTTVEDFSTRRQRVAGVGRDINLAERETRTADEGRGLRKHVVASATGEIESVAAPVKVSGEVNVRGFCDVREGRDRFDAGVAIEAVAQSRFTALHITTHRVQGRFQPGAECE